MVGPEHGHDDSAEAILRTLRADPEPRVLRWVEEATGGDEVAGIEALRGGTSAALHALTMQSSGGATRRVVLRRYLRLEHRAENPSSATIEANALELARAASLPTPLLLAVDPTGDAAGAPAVLMTHISGRPVWERSPARSWAGQLVEVAAAVHDIPAPAPGTVREFRLYRQDSYEPPRWTSDPQVWVRARELAATAVPDDRAFIHRDFHPGNLLWRGRSLRAVVDWESASIGPAAFDIAHCRLNLMYADPTLADLLRHQWERLSGQPYPPWADIAAITCVWDGLRDRPPGSGARHAIDAALARAVAALGPRG